MSRSVYRFDDQMLVTPYLYKLHGFQHPLLHIKRLGPAGIFESYARQFEAIWTAHTTAPYGARHGEDMSMGRIDYYHDPNAPAANSLVVGSSAIVTDETGRILLQRRTDSGNWALPGGKMDIGETLAASLIREVKEETGFDVAIDRIVGIYSDPAHVFAYDDGEVRQQFNICCACTISGGSIQVSSESTAVRFIDPADIDGLQIHETIRIRIRDYLADSPPVLC